MTANMASAENVQKINRRFAELEGEVRALRDDVRDLANAVGTANNLIQAQATVLANIYANGLRAEED